jgi:hypothetical protein
MEQEQPRIGLIAGGRVTAGLSFESSIFELKNSNYGAILRHGRIDFVLYELGKNKDTDYWACKSDINIYSAYDIINFANKCGVPSAIWITAYDPSAYTSIDFIKLFTAIFCVSENIVRKIDKLGFTSHLLEPCFQPAIFNPFSNFNFESESLKKILVKDEGFERNSKEWEAIILDSRQYKMQGMIARSQYEMSDPFVNSADNQKIRNVEVTQIVKADFENSCCYVSGDSDKNDPIERVWTELEAAGCGLFVIRIGDMETEHLISNVSVDVTNQAAAFIELIRIQKDDIYRERVAHKGWRNANQNHTYAIRLNKIYSILGVKFFLKKNPRVSVLAPTFRKENLGRIIQTYKSFKYDDKELIIIYNGDASLEELKERIGDVADDIRIASVPSDLFAGAALNLGALHAAGKYLFRIDDDDIYGPYYLLDMVIQAQALRADLFGKAPVPVRQAGGQQVYVKGNDISQKIIAIENLTSGKRWLAGNSVAFTRDFIEQEPFDDLLYGSADTALQLNIADEGWRCICVDRFNAVAERSHILNGHSWRAEFKDIIKDRIIYQDVSELII